MSWNKSNELSLPEVIGTIVIMVMMLVVTVFFEHCIAAGKWLSIFLITGCSSATALCSAIDRTSPSLTIAANTVQASIESEARSQCLLCSAGTDHDVCCSHAIDAAVERQRKIYTAISDAANVTDAVVVTSHEAGICK